MTRATGLRQNLWYLIVLLPVLQSCGWKSREEVEQARRLRAPLPPEQQMFEMMGRSRTDDPSRRAAKWVGEIYPEKQVRHDLGYWSADKTAARTEGQYPDWQPSFPTDSEQSPAEESDAVFYLRTYEGEILRVPAGQEHALQAKYPGSHLIQVQE